MEAKRRISHPRANSMVIHFESNVTALHRV